MTALMPLDVLGCDGGHLIVADELGSLTGKLLEDVVDERVHDRHDLAGDSNTRVHLLQRCRSCASPRSSCPLPH